MQVGRYGLGAHLLADIERSAAALRLKSRGPLAVAAVEYQHARPGFHPEHMGQIARLRRFQCDGNAGRKWRIGIKPGAAEIIARHNNWTYNRGLAAMDPRGTRL